MPTIDKLFMVFAAGVTVAGLGIVALFMGTGPTANQIRAIDGPTEPVTQVSHTQVSPAQVSPAQVSRKP